MADDINKTISVDIEVNTDGLQQIDQYKTSFDNLRTSISRLGKPLTDLSANINSVGKSMTTISDAASKAAAQIGGVLKTVVTQAEGTVNQVQASSKKNGAITATNQKKTAKDTLKTILGYFVNTEAAKTKVATDGATTTGTKVAATAKKIQDVIGANIITSTQQVSDSAYKIFTDKLQLQSQAKLRTLQNDEARALSVANLSASQKLAIQTSFKKKENDIQKKAFKEKQEADIAQAVINGAVAVTKVTAQSGVAAPFMIGAVIAETAAQIAKIASQKPPQLAKGGYFKSDGKGAVLSGYSRTDNTNAYLRSDEAVVVSEAMRDPWARNLVSAINVAFGGRDFSVPNVSRGYAVGGIFTDGGNANRHYNQPVNDQKNLANTVAYQMINNFPPVYVDVKDVNNQQNILAQTINRVTL